LLVVLGLVAFTAAIVLSVQSGSAIEFVLAAVGLILIFSGITGLALRKPVLSLDDRGIWLHSCLTQKIAWNQVTAARIEAMPRGPRLLYLDILADESIKQAVDKLHCTAGWVSDDRRTLRVGIIVEGLTLSPNAIHAKVFRYIGHN
jgi:hypothetical protein